VEGNIPAAVFHSQLNPLCPGCSKSQLGVLLLRVDDGGMVVVLGLPASGNAAETVAGDISGAKRVEKGLGATKSQVT
jgi:hypothetical protein